MNKTLLEKSYNNIFNAKEAYIQTSYSEIDSLLSKCGCTKGSLITIGGRPSMGKTTFTMNLAEQFLIKGKRCLYFSFDMSAESFLQRLIFQHAEIPLGKIMSKDFSNSDLNKLSKTKAKIEKWDLHICDASFTDIAKINDMVKKNKPDYVFVDKIQNIGANKITIRHFARKLKETIRNAKLNTEVLDKICEIINSLPLLSKYSGLEIETDISIEKINELIKEIDRFQYQEYSDLFKEIRPEYLIMDYAVKHLKIMAKKYETVIFINSDLTRVPEYREFHYPILTDLKTPQSLANLSDSVMMVYREDYYNPELEENEKNIIEVHFVKPFSVIEKLIVDPNTLKITNRPNTNIF